MSISIKLTKPSDGFSVEHVIRDQLSEDRKTWLLIAGRAELVQDQEDEQCNSKLNSTKKPSAKDSTQSRKK